MLKRNPKNRRSTDSRFWVFVVVSVFWVFVVVLVFFGILLLYRCFGILLLLLLYRTPLLFMLPLDGTCVWCDGRKGNTTQNVMVACDFRACLDWLVNCWLQWYLLCVNVKVLYDKFIYFIGKYYLIDSRYPMIKGYLQPYKRANTPSCRYLTKKQRTRGSSYTRKFYQTTR